VRDARKVPRVLQNWSEFESEFDQQNQARTGIDNGDRPATELTEKEKKMRQTNAGERQIFAARGKPVPPEEETHGGQSRAITEAVR
jgi:hypothetical protein